MHDHHPYHHELNEESSIQNIISVISELQSQKKLTDTELESIRIRLETNTSTTQEQLRVLEKSVLEIRDIARDAKHISVGVDGKNGLRGSIESLAKDVSAMTEDFNFLRQTAHSYNETKSLLLRLFVTSSVAILLQFGGAVWFVSSLHSKQESIREDLNRVVRQMDKMYDAQVGQKSAAVSK